MNLKDKTARRLKRNPDGFPYRESMNMRFAMWKSRAKLKGLDFDLTLDYMNSLPLICGFTGVELTFRSNHRNTVSLDRIDSSKGYTKDNTILCCHYVNLAKNDMSVRDFYLMCKAVVKHLS